MDIKDKTETENILGLLLLLDFDSVKWSFIQKVLEFFGFVNSIIQWFNTFYNKASSCIQNNGHCSEYISIERGVRQGDPLSPYSFILSVGQLNLTLI